MTGLQGEGRRFPVAMLADHAAVGLCANLKINTARLPIRRVSRAENIGPYGLAGRRLQMDEVLVMFGPGVRIGRVESGCTQTATEIRHPHTREHPTKDIIRSIAARGPENHGRQARLAEQLPDRNTATQVDHLGWQEAGLLLVAIQGLVEQISGRISANEIKNTVSARIGGGRKRRKGDGCLGGLSGCHRGQRSGGRQSLEVRQFARCHQT